MADDAVKDAHSETPRRTLKRLAVAKHSRDLNDALTGNEYREYLQTAHESVDLKSLRSNAGTVLEHDGLHVPPHGDAIVSDHTRQPRAPARGWQPVGPATTAHGKARVAAEKAAKDMLSQTEVRSRAEKRDLQLAVQTAATAYATSEVAASQNAAAKGLADYQTLALELQDLKRQKTADDCELQTATQNVTLAATAHDLALEAQKLSVSLDAAATAVGTRKAWDLCATQDAEKQGELLEVARNEVARASERTCEMHFEKHKLELVSMSASHELKAKVSERREGQSALLMKA